jgi:hypothetical protein
MSSSPQQLSPRPPSKQNYRLQTFYSPKKFVHFPHLYTDFYQKGGLQIFTYGLALSV